MWFHYADGRLLLTGRPGRRGWYANLLANPDFTFHLKQSLQRDIPARATPVVGKAQRQRVFQRLKVLEPRLTHWNLEEMVGRSPLVEVEWRP